MPSAQFDAEPLDLCNEGRKVRRRRGGLGVQRDAQPEADAASAGGATVVVGPIRRDGSREVGDPHVGGVVAPAPAAVHARRVQRCGSWQS